MKYSARNLAKAFLRLAQENPENSGDICEAFIDFCKQKRLFYLLPNFLHYLKIEANRDQDLQTLKIFSAVGLNESIIKKIQKACGAAPDSPAQIIEDKNVVAGFVAYYQNKIIDASLSNNLRLLKNKITA